MSKDTDSDPAASLGSHGEPIGHQCVDEYGHPSGFLSWRDGETRWPKSQTVPLYLRPQPTLTDAEREAIRSLSPSGDPLASRTVTLTPDARRVFHRLLERLG
jgi:hypothetical protein